MYLIESPLRVTGKPMDVVLVSGASGFIGAALVRTLARHYRVVGLDVKAPVETGFGKFVEIDLTTPAVNGSDLADVNCTHSCAPSQRACSES